MYIIAAILIFGVLIAVHELGHFLAAKACGVRVNEFSIGMGPAIFHTTKGETEYSLRLLPIGGFCAMEGEDEESDDPRALEKQGFACTRALRASIRRRSSSLTRHFPGRAKTASWSAT